ncbi:hypothetical protein [Dolosicoccus paucivorans]
MSYLYDWQLGKQLVRQVVDEVFDEQSRIKDQPLMTSMTEQTAQSIKAFKFQDEGRDPKDVLNFMTQSIYPYRARLNHPRFFSFIPAAHSPLSIVGEILNASYNPYGGSHTLAEGPAIAEKWLLNF